MSTIKVNIKWNKQVFENIELDQSQPPSVFKMQLFSLSGVEPDRQKIMVKGGTLKDDTDWETLKLKDGQTLMMMGTPGENKLEEVKPQVKFIEDMTEAELAKTLEVPAGLQNLGNTCYANATLQCLRSVPELRDALEKYPGQIGNMITEADHNLAAATRDLFGQMSSSTDPIPPLAWILLFRKLYPQFDQQQNGHYAQQDAEECWSQMMTAIGHRLKIEDQSFIKTYFGIEYVSTWKCDEDPEEASKVTLDTQTKLQCHITSEVNYLYQGIKEGLTEKLEKVSPKLNRSCMYTKTSLISKLPTYLTINFVRFFWRKDTQKKAKILRKVKFPLDLDMFDFCTPELQAELQPARVPFLDKDYQPNAKEKEKETDGGDSSNVMQVDVPNQKRGHNMSGFYELIAVLTHIGRSSDSGHYMAWVKKASDQWLKFDDDKVSLVNDEEILKLDGGGDWHTAYLCLYKEKKYAPKAEPKKQKTAN